jgi:methylglutaconyl-CoA hydratase
MIEFGHLRVEFKGNRARVTLNRPDVHNAFDDDIIEQLTRAAAELAASPSLRVVILAGEGKSFCAGADLHWMKRMVDYSEKENLADSLAMARMFHAWHSLPVPVVGRIHGAAIGGGVGLVSICDIAVAAAGTEFAFSEVRLGILPAVISPYAVAKIGAAAARELFLTGDRFDAARARELGLVQHVVPAASLDERIEEIVASLLSGGPQAQARIKKLIPEVTGRDPAGVEQLTAQAIARARVGAEGQAGIRAYLERRSPPWREEP